MHYTSVFLRENKGRLAAVATYKDEATGKWKRVQHQLKAKGKRAAQKEAEEWRGQLEEEWEREQLEASAMAALGIVPGTVLTVEAYVRRYIDGKRHELERSTFNEYGRYLDKQISPTLGEVPVSDLNPDTVRAWVAKLADEYAPITVRKALTLLRSAMAQAVDNDLIAKDPTRGVKAPKSGSPKPNALSPDDARMVLEVLDVANQTPAILGVKIALFTGLRESEICALTWADVDTDRRALRVGQSLGRDGGTYYVKDPKTGGSSRTVYYGYGLAADLEERREKVKADCRAAGVPFSDGFYVLGDMRGGYLRPIYLSNKWRALADALEVKGTQGKRPTFHDLRHTCATLLIMDGVDVKTVSAMLGHSNAAMTLGVYADATVEGKRRAAASMDRLLVSGDGE